MGNILKKIYNGKQFKDEKGRIYYFDNLKFILIILVVLGHFLAIPTRTSDYAKMVWLFIYFFHMPLFVFISGYFSKNAVKNKNVSKVIIFITLYVVLSFAQFLIKKIYVGASSLKIFSSSSIQWYLFSMAIWYLFSMMTEKINKKYMLLSTLIIALIVGYDKTVGDFLILSRTIVYYPFFILGNMLNEEQIMQYVKNRKLKIASILVLMIIAIVFILFIDKIYFIRPITTARNSYFSLSNDIEMYGILYRAIWYIISCIMSFSFCMLIPRGKTFFSKLGTRTLTVYFLHAIVWWIWVRFDIKLRVIEYIVFSIILTFVLSSKFLSIAFEKMMKVKNIE